MPNSYLPATDAGLLGWSANFSFKIGNSPESFGLTVTDAGQYASLQDEYASKYAAATQPETRGGATVLAKNDAKKALVAKSRTLAMQVTNNPAVTDQQRYDLGLTVKDVDPTPIGPPEEMPVVRVVAVNGRVLDVELLDQENNRRRPAGVSAAYLYSFVGPSPSSDLKEWEFRGASTRTNPQVVFPPEVVPGTVVWVTALWVNPTGKPGQACAPVKSYINYVGMNQAA